MQGGSYAGLELHGIHEVMETQENDDLNASGSLELPSPTIESLDESKDDEEEKTEPKETSQQQKSGDLI